MQFKHPELLYALLLLLIPIIIHLFKLRRFKKVPFTNVQFLKSITIQTRKSSQLKKWLTLITRLLLLAAIIFAFAQPYFSKSSNINIKAETVVYLDNSFSMQAKGSNGELLKRSIQDIIESIDDNTILSIFTNDGTLKDVNKKTINNELLNIQYSSNQLDYNAVQLKAKSLFGKNANSIKNFVFISDFQQRGAQFDIQQDENIQTNLVKLAPLNTFNIGIDTVYVSKTSAANIELTVKLNIGRDINNTVSVSLYDNDNLIAKSSVDNETSSQTTFTIPNNSIINGKLSIEDASLQFDNTLFFNINNRENINVLSINADDNEFLKRVYTSNEFNYNGLSLEQLNYNIIESQNLIVLNELKSIPIALINALNNYSDNGGSILIIPSNEASLLSYNQLIKNNKNTFNSYIESEKKITSINYSHPILSDVFDKKITNFQYPKVNSYYNLNSNTSPILQFEDGRSFLTQIDNFFMFSAALNKTNSNFTNSPLIVPALYNIGRQSLNLPQLYYTIGFENNYDINTSLRQDDILKLTTTSNEIIPQQRTFSNKVSITSIDSPNEANIYDVVNNNTTLQRVSYNYDRSEGLLKYLDLSTIEHTTISDSIPQVFNTIKSDTNINALWKWFTIFALVLLVIEMLILKYFK